MSAARQTCRSTSREGPAGIVPLLVIRDARPAPEYAEVLTSRIQAGNDRNVIGSGVSLASPSEQPVSLTDVSYLLNQDSRFLRRGRRASRIPRFGSLIHR